MISSSKSGCGLKNQGSDSDSNLGIVVVTHLNPR